MKGGFMNDLMQTAPIRMRGWEDNGRALCAEASNLCNYFCGYCFREEFHLQRLPNELTLKERLNLIDQAADLGMTSYELVGAGEPLIDPLAITQLIYAAGKGLTPIVFTNGSSLGDNRRGLQLAQTLYDIGATVVVKWHSFRHELHDEIVGKLGAGEQRDKALSLLEKLGFNSTKPTRLGIDNILFKKTVAEFPDCLRMCRRKNFCLVASTFIPSGLTKDGYDQELDPKEVVKVFGECERIDREEFAIEHSIAMPYIGYGKTCTQYRGLYVTITGDMFGCVGQSESYGNIRDRSLADAWTERLPLLKTYDAGCPPREHLYRSRKEQFVQIESLFV